MYKGTLLEKSIYLEDAKMRHKGKETMFEVVEVKVKVEEEMKCVVFWFWVEKQHKQALSPTFHLYHYVFITLSLSHMRENRTKQSLNIRTYALIRLVKATKWVVCLGKATNLKSRTKGSSIYYILNWIVCPIN